MAGPTVAKNLPDSCNHQQVNLRNLMGGGDGYHATVWTNWESPSLGRRVPRCTTEDSEPRRGRRSDR